jgi:hypothetical protein
VITRRNRIPLVVFSFATLSGCTPKSAPTFLLFGAFFPAWLMCALVSIVGAIVVRVLFVATGLSNILPLQLFVCAALGLLVGMLTWLVWFG